MNDLTPITRKEWFLDRILKRGGGGGGGGSGVTVEPLAVSENGEYSAPSGKAYNPVTVNVPSSGITPVGTKSITENGTGIDVTNFAAVDVNVPSGGGSSIDDLVSKQIVNADVTASSIGSYAFYQCTELVSVSIPNVTSIGSHAFDGCRKLSGVLLPDGITELPAYTFQGCFALTSMTIPSSVTSIKSSAFSGCSSLSSITVLASTPPTLNSQSLVGMPADTIIYVPASSVDAYKNDTYWSSRSSYIQAIP